MATKKTPTKSQPAPAPPAPDLASELAQAKLTADDLRARLRRAENELRSARAISTIDHRLPKVAEATGRVARLRDELAEADTLAAELKAAIGGRLYRTAAVTSPKDKPASPEARKGVPKR